MLESRLSEIWAAAEKEREKLSEDPVTFFEQVVGFKPTAYQVDLAEKFVNHQFTAMRWNRQSGKSWIASALLLNYALTHPDCYIGIVAPSWRQSKLVIRRIRFFLRKLPKEVCPKPGRTVLYFSNGSVIEAFPNNPDTIRGPTLNCLPGHVKVALSDGSQIPISQLKPGQEILSYSRLTGKIEPKKILKVFVNPLIDRKITRVFHDFGHLDCTEDHKIFTLNRGYVSAIALTSEDKSLCLSGKTKYRVGAKNQNALQIAVNRLARAAYLRWALRRFMRKETKGRKEKCPPLDKSFLKTSRIRSVQILDIKRFCKNSAVSGPKSRLGKRANKIQHFVSSSIYRDLRFMLFKWAKNHFSRMVIKSPFSLCIGNLVYGRRQSRKALMYEDQHSQFYGKRARDSSTMVTRSLGNKFDHKTGFQKTRLVSQVSCERQRPLLRFNQRACYFEHAIQDSSRVEASSMRHMRQPRSTKKSRHFCGEKGCMFKPRMQENVSETQSRLETETAKTMPDMRKDFRTNTGEGKRMFPRVQTIIQASAKEAPQIKKQEIVTPKDLYLLWVYLYPNTWQSKNMQPKMPQATKTEESTPLRAKDEVVYDIEVEDNHNFFANSILVSNCIYWDEANFTPNDWDMYTAILFTISATKGKVLISSTPWNIDSVFYKIFHSEEFSDFARSHVTWKQSMEPNGPLDKGTLEKIRKQFGEDPWRWKREMEAEWVEDETAWLSQALITKCIATEKTLGEELELWGFEEFHKDCNLYAGLDLGRVKDYSVLVVIEKVKGKFYLRHIKIFPLGTSYASVIGYVKTLQDRWDGFCKIRVDSTNQDYVVEDMQKSEIDNVEGVRFSLPRKQEMATLLKQRMLDNKFWFPYFTWERPYRGEFVTELNVERFELRKDGSISFNHPQGTHDDVWWSVALALFATVEMTEEPTFIVTPR